MNQNKARNKGAGEPIDLFKSVRLLLPYWPYIIASILLFVGLSFLYLKSATPFYEITSSVLIREGERAGNLTESPILSDLENIKTTVKLDNEIEKLRSKSLLNEAVISKSAFVTFYDKIGIFKREISPYNVSINIVVHEFNEEFLLEGEVFTIKVLNEKKFEIEFAKNKKTEFNFGDKIKTEFGVFSLEKKSEEDAISFPFSTFVVRLENPIVKTERYAKALNFEQSSVKSSTLFIRLLDSSPTRGKQILNSLIEGYNTSNQNQKNEVALKTIKFLDEKLFLAKKELDSLEMYVERFKQRNRVTDIGLDSRIYLESTASTSKEISELSNKIEILESIESLIAVQGSGNETIPSSFVTLDPTLSELLSKYNDLLRERQRISRIVQPNNQQLISLNEQLSSLKSNILQNIRSNRSNFEITRKNLEENLNVNRSQVQRIPVIERELMEIDRQKGIKQEHYQYLLRKRDESALALEVSGVSSLQVIDAPTASVKPVSPKKLTTIGIGFLAGLALPIIVLFLKYNFSERITSKKIVEGITQVPILGEVGKNEEKGYIVVKPGSISPPAEQFRLIRSNLGFLSKNENQIIAISSSMSKEGKSFTSINLAISLSLVGKKVVLVDFDLRRPSILKALNLNSEISLNNYFNESINDFKKIIIPSGIDENLSVLGLNTYIENPSELINSNKVLGLLKSLRSSFDYVIVDTSPMGLVADPLSLSEAVDVLIYVIRLNYTKVSQLEEYEEVVQNNIFKRNFLVLNDAEKLSSSKFGYGYYSSDKSIRVKHKA